MRVWVTKYALSKGIYEVDAALTSHDGMILDKNISGSYYHHGEWYIHPKHAAERAEELRAAKIKSLQRQIAKLEKMTFGQ